MGLPYLPIAPMFPLASVPLPSKWHVRVLPPVALEGLKFKSFNGDVEMRKADHQLQQTLYISSWKKASGAPNDYSVENTGYNFQPVKYYEPYVASTPTSCQMKRPG